MRSDRRWDRKLRVPNDLASNTATVARPNRTRRRRRKWWKSWEAIVSRREAVETVKDIVVGEGRNVVRWDRVFSIGSQGVDYILIH